MHAADPAPRCLPRCHSLHDAMPFLHVNCTVCKKDGGGNVYFGGNVKLGAKAADACDYDWLSFAQMRARLVRHHTWLLFVGDSDTRFLVYELLQILAAGSHSARKAEQYPGLWLALDNLGPTPQNAWNYSKFNKSQAANWFAMATDWMRLCLVDIIYDAKGSIVSRDSVHCIAKRDFSRETGTSSAGG